MTDSARHPEGVSSPSALTGRGKGFTLKCDYSLTFEMEDPLSVLISKTRAQGASIVTTLPAEVVRRLGIPAGRELEWIEDGLGGFRVVPHTPELSEALDAHEKIMAEYDSVFRNLAK